MRRLLLGLMPIFLTGCALSSVKTYTAPVPSAPPAGMVRIEPKTPVITKTKATCEWQVIFDKGYGLSYQPLSSSMTFSGGRSVDRMMGELPTAGVMFIEVETFSHGDGTMAMKISSGFRDAETRPLLDATTKPIPRGGTTNSSTVDGFKEGPASSFVVPILSSSTLTKVPSMTELALINIPAPSYANFEAIRTDKAHRSETVYIGAVPINAKGEIPDDAYLNPRIKEMQDKGYVIASASGIRARKEKFTATFKP